MGLPVAVVRRLEYVPLTGNNGRRLEIGPHEFYLRSHREWMATEEAKSLYQKRKELPEPVFGIIKECLAGRRFLLRGIANVQSEAALLATAFNLRTLYKIWRTRMSLAVQWIWTEKRLDTTLTVIP